MKTVFEQLTRCELIDRVNSLTENSNRLWGKMNVYQMAKHCTIWFEWVLGKDKPVYKVDFLGKLFGRMALKSNTKDDKPIGKNMPAGKFAIKEKEGDLKEQQIILIKCIEEFENYDNPDFVHDFFGQMTREQIGVFSYKHVDHHLRQFGV